MKAPLIRSFAVKARSRVRASFARGLVIALPASVLLWAVLFWLF